MANYQFNPDTTLKRPTPEELKAADKEAEIICLLQGEDGELGAGWIYMAIRPSLYSEFKRLSLSGEPFIPAEYGRILLSGTGTPGAEDKEFMQREYGYDEDYLAKLEKDIKDQQKTFFDKKEIGRINDIVAMMKAGKKPF